MSKQTLTERVDLLEKNIIRIETRIDEKFNGIDGRLKGIDISLSDVNKHIDRKFTHLMVTGGAGILSLIVLIIQQVGK